MGSENHLELSLVLATAKTNSGANHFRLPTHLPFLPNRRSSFIPIAISKKSDKTQNLNSN